MHHWTPIIIAHTSLAFTAFFIGLIMFARRKGDQKHRWIGRSWALLLTLTAVSSFFIKTSGQFSWIHLVSVGTLFFLIRAVFDARNGLIERHKSTMISLYFGSLVIAGLFTFMPGRLLNQVLMRMVDGLKGNLA
jgi:uncharacterized membrane protein